MRLAFPALALLTVLGAYGAAADDDDHYRARELREAGEIVPLEQILESARALVPGRVLEVELKQEHGVRVYGIEILDRDGRVWELEYAAGNGELIEREEAH